MYTIGEFSNLAHVSARSLRYYDAMGLLRPAHMGENGYRYYTGGQLPALAKIETLKSYGFTLAEVKELLLLPETELAHRIHVRRISAYAQLNEMRRVIRRMEAAIVQMEGTSMANDTYHVILMQAPAQKVFSVRRTIQIGEMHDLFAELRAQMKRAGVRRTGPTQARYHGEEFSYELKARVQVLRRPLGLLGLAAAARPGLPLDLLPRLGDLPFLLLEGLVEKLVEECRLVGRRGFGSRPSWNRRAYAQARLYVPPCCGFPPAASQSPSQAPCMSVAFPYCKGTEF